ncbi:MAG: N-acetylmuramoyl-L-alanine amidase [Planctomycetes bacterium]|nr:N-acetylmuramoyl-L-alanine amidase [Planctomycetota bacterium]
MVDAGHGGRDPGAIGVGPMHEKDVNLQVAQRVAELLNGWGATVRTTRDHDRFVSLDSRAAFAERCRADLFVSIHADAARRSSAAGATIYIARGANRDSQEAAQSIAAALSRAGIACRGIHGAGFRVLVGHSRPAVLIECGFLTNPREAWRLSTPSYQAHLAKALAEGIADHFAP